MCNILVLNPGVLPIKQDFINMCHNNWHAFGLVTMIDGKLDIVKETAGTGEIDHEKIWTLLNRDIGFTRILHVRHMTAGNNDIENAHPFDVFFSNKRRVVFMHNGTMFQYKSKKYVPSTSGYTAVDDDEGPSDTKNFVDRILSPYFAAVDFGGGKGDIVNPLVKQFLLPHWPTGNRGLVIANGQEPLFLGEWKKIKGQDGADILSSNDDYFSVVKRGPEHQRREESRKKAEAAAEAKKNSTTSTGSITTTITALSSVQVNRKHPVNDLGNQVKSIMSDYKIWDRETAIGVGALTRDELHKIHSEKGDCVALMDWIFSDYSNLYDEFQQLLKKKEAQDAYIKKMIAEQKKDAA